MSVNELAERWQRNWLSDKDYEEYDCTRDEAWKAGHAAGWEKGIERAAELLDAFHAISGEHAELAQLVRDLKRSPAYD